jgi:hypothetical protein
MAYTWGIKINVIIRTGITLATSSNVRLEYTRILQDDPKPQDKRPDHHAASAAIEADNQKSGTRKKMWMYM